MLAPLRRDKAPQRTAAAAQVVAVVFSGRVSHLQELLDAARHHRGGLLRRGLVIFCLKRSGRVMPQPHPPARRRQPFVGGLCLHDSD